MNSLAAGLLSARMGLCVGPHGGARIVELCLQRLTTGAAGAPRLARPSRQQAALHPTQHLCSLSAGHRQTLVEGLPDIRRVSLLDLHRQVACVSAEAMVETFEFLRGELPVRIAHHNQALAELCGASPELRPTLKASLAGNSAAADRISQSPQVIRSDNSRAFAKALAAIGAEFETDLGRVLGELGDRVRWHGHSLAVDHCLDEIHLHMAAWRLLVGEYSKAVSVLEGPPSNTVQRRMWHSRLRSAVVPACPLVDLMTNTAEDGRAFCIEKNSNSPDVTVTGNRSLRACVLDDHLAFVVTELLKNSMQPLVDKYGAWDVDEATPIEVFVSESATRPGHCEIRITDTAGGIPEEKRAKLFHWLSTSADSQASSEGGGWGYSRNHGAQFTGIGVGVNVAEVYCRLMGADLTWEHHQGGTTATVSLPMAGHPV